MHGQWGGERNVQTGGKNKIYEQGWGRMNHTNKKCDPCDLTNVTHVATEVHMRRFPEPQHFFAAA